MLHFIYFFLINISNEYFKHAAHSPFFSSKCRLFHNATFFGSCIIHILHTGCAKIQMWNSGAKRLIVAYRTPIPKTCHIRIVPTYGMAMQFNGVSWINSPSLIANWTVRIIIINIIISFTASGGFWPPRANVASDLYPGHPPANFYNPFSLRLPLPRQYMWISVGHVLIDLQGLATISL